MCTANRSGAVQLVAIHVAVETKASDEKKSHDAHLVSDLLDNHGTVANHLGAGDLNLGCSSKRETYTTQE